jgi:hypothetical protein
MSPVSSLCQSREAHVTWLVQVKQLSAAALPLIEVFNATVINNPVASGALDRVAMSPLVNGIVERLQNLTSQGTPAVQTLLVSASLHHTNYPNHAIF